MGYFQKICEHLFFWICGKFDLKIYWQKDFSFLHVWSRWSKTIMHIYMSKTNFKINQAMWKLMKLTKTYNQTFPTIHFGDILSLSTKWRKKELNILQLFFLNWKLIQILNFNSFATYTLNPIKNTFNIIFSIHIKKGCLIKNRDYGLQYKNNISQASPYLDGLFYAQENTRIAFSGQNINEQTKNNFKAMLL